MDIIKVNATNLDNNVEPIVQGRLVNCKANVLIKSGMQPSYFESRPLPMPISIFTITSDHLRQKRL